MLQDFTKNRLLCITSSYIIIHCIIIDLPQFIDVVVKLYLLEHVLHHRDQNALVPLIVVIRRWGVSAIRF